MPYCQKIILYFVFVLDVETCRSIVSFQMLRYCKCKREHCYRILKFRNSGRERKNLFLQYIIRESYQTPFQSILRYFIVNKGAEIIRPKQVITCIQFRIGLERGQKKRKRRERRDLHSYRSKFHSHLFFDFLVSCGKSSI